MSRVLRSVCAALAVAALMLLAAPAAHAEAAAAGFTTVDACQGTPPTPVNPLANGPLSAVMPVPKVVPPQGDPWNPADKTTVMSQYGSAGATWNTYDTGCGVGTEFMPNFWTGIANFLTLGPQWFTCLTASIANWVLSPESWLPTLDKPVDAVSSSLVGSFATPLLPIVIAAASVAIAWSAFRRAQFGKALSILGFVLLGVGLVGLATHTPSRIAGTLDGAVSGTVSEVMGGSNLTEADRANLGAKVIAPMWDAVAYDRWLEGEFGSATSKTAQTYGPRLFKAQALTWAEAVKVDGDAAATKALYDAKGQEWAKVAQEVKDADPSAYAFLTGGQGPARVGTGFIAGIVALACLPFVLVALGMTAGGFIALRFMAALLPIFGVCIVIFRGLGRTLLSILGAVVVNTVVFAAGAASVIAISGAVLKSDLNMILAVLIVFLMSFICWLVLKPFRTLTRMVSNPGKGFQNALEAPQDAAQAVKRFAGKAAASFAGNEAADIVGQDDDAKADPAKGPESNRPEVHETGPTAAPSIPGQVMDIMRQEPTQRGPAPEPAEPEAPESSPGVVRQVADIMRQEPVQRGPAPTQPPEPEEPAPVEHPTAPVGPQRIWDSNTKAVRLVTFNPDGTIRRDDPPEDETGREENTA